METSHMSYFSTCSHFLFWIPPGDRMKLARMKKPMVQCLYLSFSAATRPSSQLQPETTSIGQFTCLLAIFITTRDDLTEMVSYSSVFMLYLNVRFQFKATASLLMTFQLRSKMLTVQNSENFTGNYFMQCSRKYFNHWSLCCQNQRSYNALMIITARRYMGLVPILWTILNNVCFVLSFKDGVQSRLLLIRPIYWHTPKNLDVQRLPPILIQILTAFDICSILLHC